MVNKLYLTSLLGEITQKKRPIFEPPQIQRLFRWNLSKTELYDWFVLKTYFDLLNFKAFLKELPITFYGNYTMSDFEKIHSTKGNGFVYFHDILQHYTEDDFIEHFPKITDYWLEMIHHDHRITHSVLKTLITIKSLILFRQHTHLQPFGIKLDQLKTFIPYSIYNEIYYEHQNESKIFNIDSLDEVIKKQDTIFDSATQIMFWSIDMCDKIKGENIFKNLLIYYVQFVLYDTHFTPTNQLNMNEEDIIKSSGA